MGLIKTLFRKTERRKLIARLFGYEWPDTPFSKFYEWIQEHRKLTIALVIVMVMAKVIIAICTYNDFNNRNHAVNNARGNLEGCLQMHENLISQMVATMCDFVKHEDIVFFHSSDVRADSINPRAPDNKSAEPGKEKNSGDNLEKLFSRLIAVAENYPELKTSESFQILMSKTAEVEKEILNKRIDYNAKAYEYNVKVTAFPGIVYAFFYGFKAAKYFQWKGESEWVSENITE